MELQDYFRIVRKRWRIITTMLVLGLSGAAAFTHFTAKSYQATTKLFVSTSSGNSSAADLANGSAFAQKQMKTYADVMTSDVVLGPVSHQLHLNGTEELKRSVTVLVPADTVLLQIQTTHQDPAYAVRVSNAVARQFAKTVQSLQPGAAVKASVVQSAVTPTDPVSPRPLLNLGVGLGLGLLIGLGLGILRQLTDTTVKDEEDVASVTDCAVIGLVHQDPAASRRPLLLQGDMRSPRAEAFRAIRTNLQFLNATHRPRIIMVTSALAGEGKTSTAGNLAITLGASGASVCVVEADLRRPQLLQYMGLEGSVGLTNVLVGQAGLDDVLQTYTKNVVALGAGPLPPNPSELLGTERMRTLVESLSRHFDHVVVDVPPLLPVTDAAVVSQWVDGTIVVARAGRTRRDALIRSMERLRTVEANVLGIVLTQVPRADVPSYSYQGKGDTTIDLAGVTNLSGTSRHIDLSGTPATAEATAGQDPALAATHPSAMRSRGTRRSGLADLLRR